MHHSNDNSMPLWHNGPSPNSFYSFPGSSQACPDEFNTTSAPGMFGTQHAGGPITTGTSVIGLKFDGGVIISADSLVSYGSLARFRDIDRVFNVNDYTIMGAGGDYADFQFIKRHIDKIIIEDYSYDDNIQCKPKSLYNWLCRVLYNKRSRFQPLYLDLVIGGMQDGEPFLGHINMRGRAYESSVIATGYGTHLALPLMREVSERPASSVSKDEAIAVTKKCMEVMFYRDCRGFQRYKYAICTKDGSAVEGPFNVEQNWKLATMIKGY